MAEALTAALKELHEQMINESSIDTYLSGTTALVVVVGETTGKVTIANVGDSRVVLVKEVDVGKFNAVALST